MKREWSFHRSEQRKRRKFWLIFLGIILFVLGFFAARPLFLLLGLV